LIAAGEQSGEGGGGEMQPDPRLTSALKEASGGVYSACR